MLVRLRVGVPDRPGSLGQVASALGSAGADIVRVEVLDSESGRAVDDVFVQVRDSAHLQRVRERLASLPGIDVAGVQHPAPATPGHAELELILHVLANPDAGAQVLADGIPLAVGADWAAVLRFERDSAAGVVAASTACPGAEAFSVAAPLRLGAVTVARTDREAHRGAGLAPLGGTGLALLAVREEGPAFHRHELWRLGKIADITGSALGRVVRA